MYCAVMAQIADWNVRTAAQIGARVARFRKQPRNGRPMSTQTLADRMTALGHPMDRTVLVKLEKGGRQSVTVAELVVLAKALGVPPIALIYSPGWEDEAEALPGHTVPVWNAMKWFAGEQPLANPGGEGVAPEELRELREDRAGLESYRWHDQYVADWRADHAAAEKAREQAEKAATDTERAALLDQAKTREQLAETRLAPLHAARSRLREHGMRLPELPEELQHIDDDYQPDWGWMRS